MTRLLFVNHTLDFKAGGAERVLLEVLRRIDRARLEPSVFVGRDPLGVPAEFQALSIPIHVHRPLPLGVSFGLPGILTTLFAIVSLAYSLWRTLRRDRIDVVHVNSIFALHFALLPCRLRRVPLVFHEHGLARDREGSPWARAYPWMISRVSHTIAITEAVRQEVLSYGVMPTTVTTIHNGIDSRDPSAAVRDDPAAEPARGFTIVQIANFLAWKGHDTVVRALERLRQRVPDARVVFYGQSKDLEFEAKIRALIKELALEEAVEFGGFRHDLMSLLPRFDCLVVASRAEPFGLVLLEAMRAGVPVVATRAGGVPEIVSDGVNGLLFEPSDADGLAKALERIALEPTIAESLQRQGRLVVEKHFSLEAQLEKMHEVFDAQAGQGVQIRLGRPRADERQA